VQLPTGNDNCDFGYLNEQYRNDCLTLGMFGCLKTVCDEYFLRFVMYYGRPM